jgi:hypothetical protein
VIRLRNPRPILLLALLACCTDPPGDDEPAAAPAPAAMPARASTPAPATASDSAAIALEGDGLRIFIIPSGSARPIPFGTPAADVIALLTKILGSPPREEGDSPECGGRFATWSAGLTTWFTRGAFAGWHVSDGSRLTTASGIGLGSTRADVESAYAVEVRRTSLGVEFTAGKLAGILESSQTDAHVLHLWAGVTCVAR